MSDCVRRNTNKGFASSVIISDYENMNEQFMLSEHVGQPFVLGMRSCLGGLRKWAAKKETKIEQLLVAIEDGDEDSGQLIKAARIDGFRVVPLQKLDALAFQAADIAAWKFRTAIHNATYGPLKTEEDARNILRSMSPVKMLVQKNGVYDKNALAYICREGRIPRRHGTMNA